MYVCRHTRVENEYEETYLKVKPLGSHMTSPFQKFKVQIQNGRSGKTGYRTDTGKWLDPTRTSL